MDREKPLENKKFSLLGDIRLFHDLTKKFRIRVLQEYNQRIRNEGGCFFGTPPVMFRKFVDLELQSEKL